MKRASLSADSSRLVSVPAIVIWFAGGFVSDVAGFEVPAGILFFLGTVGLAARLLAKHSADKLEISVGCEPCCIFPDSVISFSYNINNGKQGSFPRQGQRERNRAEAFQSG